MTINQPEEIKAFRRSPPGAILRPDYTSMWRPLHWNVDDMPQRAVAGEKANNAYFQTLATLVETRTVQQLAEPLTRRVAEPPSPKPAKPSAKPRFVRGLNPLKAEDAALLVAISDPKWMVDGLKNRDLVAALFATPPADDKERRRRSSRVTRLLRILRGHGLIEKIPRSHRYSIPEEARTKIQVLLAIRNANAEELTRKAA